MVSTSLTSYANIYGVDPNIAQAVAQVESGGRQNVSSGAGAVGIMQLEPSTFNSLTAPSGQVFQSTGLPYFTDINDPQQNMEAGTYYLSKQYQNYGDYPTALAAYNAGPGAVNKFGGIPPYNETQNYVNNVSKLAANAGSTSSNLTAQNLQNTINSQGEPDSIVATTAQPIIADPPTVDPIVTNLQIDNGLTDLPWYDDPSLITGHPHARKSVLPVSFRIFLSQQTGEALVNPTTKKPIELQLNASISTIEIQSKHMYNHTPSRTGHHVTFWGMQPDLLTGAGSTGVFMNQFGITDWFSVANVTDDMQQQVQQAFQGGQDVILNNTSNPDNAYRVAAQDAFIEFLKMFQMNGNVYFYNPNYAGYQTGQEQSTPTGWSAQTGMNTLQQNARNNDVFSRGYVQMNFKNNTYLGYFKSMSWTMDAEKPFQWLFNFVFQVERTLTTLYYPSGSAPVVQQTVTQSGNPPSTSTLLPPGSVNA